MENEKPVTNEVPPGMPDVRHYTPKPISLDRAVKICATLGNRLDDDQDVDLLLELVMGMSIDTDRLEALGTGKYDVANYHNERGVFCAVELFRHTRRGWNAMCDHLFDIGIAEERKRHEKRRCAMKKVTTLSNAPTEDIRGADAG